MGRLLRAFILLVGLLALVAGTVAAAYVGPDDRVWLAPVETGAAPGQAVVTAPGLTSYRDLDLLVRATAPQGVFLGAGHPVDVSDLAGQADHYELTGIHRTKLVGSSRRARAEDPVAVPAPARLDLWTTASGGEGVQEIALELDGSPTQVFAEPVGDHATTLQFGVHLGGAFLTSLVVGFLGLLVVGLAAWLRVRTRRGRLPAVAALGAVALVASGCGWVPDQVPRTVPTKEALPAAGLDATVASIDARLDRARRAANASYATEPWRQVDAGPALAHLFYVTRLRESLRPEPLEPMTHEPLEVFSPTFTSYPLWAVTIADQRTGARGLRPGDAEDESDDKRVILTVIERTSAASPWKRRAWASVPRRDVPDPVAVPQPPGTGATRDARKAVNAAMAYLAGRPARGVVVDKLARDFRKFVATTLEEDAHLFGSSSLEVFPPVYDVDALRLVAVEGGTLAVAVRKVRHHMSFAGSRRVDWVDSRRAVNGTDAQGLYTEHNVVLALLLPDDGATPRLLSTTLLSDLA